MIALRRPAGRDDDGYSLIEVVVTMSIMSVVLAVVIGALVQIYSAVNRVDTTSVTRDQLSTAFRRLDKELRYASWVSTPGQVGTVWYFEYAMPKDPDRDPEQVKQRCRQLAYNNGVLTLAAWTDPSTTPTTTTTIATGLTPSDGQPPFSVYPAGSKPYATASPGTAGVGRSFSPEYAQIRLRFTATQGKTSLPYDVVFTAQNNTGNTPAANDCSKGRPTS